MNSIEANFTKRFERGAEIRVEVHSPEGADCVIVLFGPSGVGKTTLLRCLAGFERPEEGTLRFGNEVWFDSVQRIFVTPSKRRIGFVPQDYGLFPHLTVEENIAYGLKERGTDERRGKVAEILGWLDLKGLEHRFPKELSSGQQQRAALARAVVTEPQLLLLDEPFAALDARLRTRLRTELRQFLKKLGMTTIIVTHDRAEALALGDELWVMAQGKLVQSGKLKDVFSRPVNAEVAAMIGVETVQPARVLEIKDGLALVEAGTAKLTALATDLEPSTKEVYLCIRAEDVIVASLSPGRTSARNSLPATVRQIMEEGALIRLELDCGFPLAAVLTRQACAELELKSGSQVAVLIKAPQIQLIPRTQ